jgi:hypothetical protein
MPWENLLHTFENMDVEYAKTFSQAANRSGEHSFPIADSLQPRCAFKFKAYRVPSEI